MKTTLKTWKLMAEAIDRTKQIEILHSRIYNGNEEVRNK